MNKEGEVEGAVGETKSIGCWLFSSWGGGQSPGRGTVCKSTEWSQNYRLEYKYAVMRVYLTVGWAVLRESHYGRNGALGMPHVYGSMHVGVECGLAGTPQSVTVFQTRIN